MPDLTHTTVGLAELHIADVSSRWEDIGFYVFCGSSQLGNTRLLFEFDDEHADLTPNCITAWGLSGTTRTELVEQNEGIKTFVGEQAVHQPNCRHPNHATHIDHVVLNTPHLPRTLQTLEDAGFILKRVREASQKMDQAFYRLGDVILEVVGHPSKHSDEPASLWGFICAVPNLEQTAVVVGEQLGSIRDAVQLGHKIATLTRNSPISVPLGFIAKSDSA